MNSNKDDIRKEFLNRRKSLNSEYVGKASSKIIESILSLKIFDSSEVVSSYFPFRNEVELLPLLSLTESKLFVFPRVVKGSKKLDFYRINTTNDFEKGVFGLMEPKTFLPKIEIKDIALFLVPGVTFTKSGIRLGYGGGYYDETLKHSNDSSVKIGICFDIQIKDSIPTEQWDLKMDYIITESEVIKSSQ